MAAFTDINATGGDWTAYSFLVDELWKAMAERAAAVNRSWVVPFKSSVGNAANMKLMYGDINWREWAEFIESLAPLYVDHTQAGGDGSFAIADASGGLSEIPLFDLASFRAAAGLHGDGFRRARRHPDEGGMFLYGLPETGDIMGPWLIEDFQKALAALKWTKQGTGSGGYLETFVPANTVNNKRTGYWGGDPPYPESYAQAKAWAEANQADSWENSQGGYWLGTTYEMGPYWIGDDLLIRYGAQFTSRPGYYRMRYPSGWLAGVRPFVWDGYFSAFGNMANLGFPLVGGGIGTEARRLVAAAAEEDAAVLGTLDALWPPSDPMNGVFALSVVGAVFKWVFTCDEVG